MNTTLEKLKERIKDKKIQIDYTTSNNFYKPSSMQMKTI